MRVDLLGVDVHIEPVIRSWAKSKVIETDVHWDVDVQLRIYADGKKPEKVAEELNYIINHLLSKGVPRKKRFWQKKQPTGGIVPHNGMVE